MDKLFKSDTTLTDYDKGMVESLAGLKSEEELSEWKDWGLRHKSKKLQGTLSTSPTLRFVIHVLMILS